MAGRIRRRIGLALLWLPVVASAQAVPDADAADAAFRRMRQLCAADDGRAWGVRLCGPVLLADPATRRVVADRDGVDTALERDGTVFRGRLPDDMPVANTAVEWNGRRWTMLMLPLPEEEPARSILFMHEAWHRIQAQAGLPPTHADQDHLETAQGRAALRLELRALHAAMVATRADLRQQAGSDAMTFRAWRQARFPGARAAEEALERHEGLAEYTGRLLAQDAALEAHLAEHLRRGDGLAAYARSFAYYTGPAYGALLDRAAPDWRSAWNREDGLPQLLAAASGAQPDASDAAFQLAGRRYGLAAVEAEEATRARHQAEAVAELRARLVDGPVLGVPVNGARFSFDPNRVTPLPPQGAVYGVIRVAADWGVLDVDGDGLLSSDWKRLSVAHAGARQTAAGWTGPGWVLTLAPGWELRPAAREGDWTLRRQE
ncbi:RIPOR family protein [Stenotrophomonas mori]|uniref:Uncharacterized protein n=1 Tax=Stenotrophomonas mori TaxID=2871096 RepID=A0ABT0SGG0_9GAMM|nr:RIPOR family protein [Stenotrophomonas mori]MCL7714399.1 hypothetical protein [Stenotrophomonas mori]